MKAPVADVALTAGTGIAAGLSRITIDGKKYSLAIGAGACSTPARSEYRSEIRGRHRLAAALAAIKTPDA